MTRRAFYAASLFLMLVLAAVGAQAQAPQRVSVPFKFYVGDTTFAPGTYYIVQVSAGARLEVRDSNQKAVSQIAVITRLAPKGGRPSTSLRLVFDEMSPNDRHLSEVWIPGTDGFLVRATAEKHVHAVVPPES